MAIDGVQGSSEHHHFASANTVREFGDVDTILTRPPVLRCGPPDEGRPSSCRSRPPRPAAESVRWHGDEARPAGKQN
ncbi:MULTISPECIES: hypothetical protein [Streptomyces]|uniref:hypothetical protein n=1 Tax=Streptomyces TaxID=1883 RepID=UPI0011610857|nr:MULTISPECIES: hypothetical protein [Streptomyces]